MLKGIYSPKVREDLIPYLYKSNQHLNIPKTKLVSQLVQQAISHFKETGIFSGIETDQKTIKDLTTHFQKLRRDRKTKTAEVIALWRKITQEDRHGRNVYSQRRRSYNPRTA